MKEIAEFQPQEQALIHDLIVQVDRTRDAKVWGQAVVYLSQALQKHPLQEIERQLRKLDSNTFLVAKPLSEFERDTTNSCMPHSGETEYSYALWVELKGEDEAIKLLQRMGINLSENFERLADTGLLIAKPNHPAKKFSQS